jgi:hypothetical protein
MPTGELHLTAIDECLDRPEKPNHDGHSSTLRGAASTDLQPGSRTLIT